MAKVTNLQLMGMSKAIEELSGKRFDNTLLRVRIAKIRRILNDQRELIGPIEVQIAHEYALRNEQNQIVSQNGFPTIDPTKIEEWKKARNALFADTFEVPYEFSLNDLDSAKETDNDGKVRAYIPAPWVYDELLTIIREED